MDSSDFLVKALGLQGVSIESSRYNDAVLTCSITARQTRDGCVCHRCGGKLYGTHSYRSRKLRGVPFGCYQKVVITFYQVRGACDRCQKICLAKATFIHPRFRRVTCAFTEYACRLMEEITCEAVGRLMDYDSKQLWKIDQWRMEEMKKRLTLPEDLDVSLLSADEIHMRTIKPKTRKWDKNLWDKKFITNLVCYKHSKVIANAAGRNARSLKKCLMELTEPQRLSVDYLAVDMHDGFIKAAAKLCPNASIVVDRFHLAEQINNRFDEVRKMELKLAEENKDIFQEGMLSPSRRFVLVEREKDLSKADHQMLERLRELNKNIHNAMMIVEYFHRTLDKKTVKKFRKSLEMWYRLVKESGLKPFLGFAKLVRKYRLRIEAYIRSHLTTAVSEGLNNKIKVLKRMGYGYTNQKSFMNKILQRCGFLNSRFINTNSWFWHVPEPHS